MELQSEKRGRSVGLAIAAGGRMAEGEGSRGLVNEGLWIFLW